VKKRGIGIGRVKKGKFKKLDWGGELSGVQISLLEGGLFTGAFVFNCEGEIPLMRDQGGTAWDEKKGGGKNLPQES